MNFARAPGLLALLVAVAFAGCTGDTPGEAGGPTLEDPGSSDADGAAWRDGAAALAADGAPRTRYENLTLGPTQGGQVCLTRCNPGDHDGEVVLDLNDLVPVGVPSWLTVVTTSTTGPGGINAHYAYLLHLGPGETYHDDIEYAGGTATETMRVLRAAESSVVLRIGRNVDASAATAVRVAVRVEPIVDMLAPSLPYAVTLPAGATHLVLGDANATSQGRVRVWDDGDTYVADVGLADGPVEVALPANATGDYVVLLWSDGPRSLAVRAPAHAAPPALRLLAVAEVPQPPVEVTQGGETTATLELDRAPLRIGFRYGRDACCYVFVEGTVALESPNGPVRSAMHNCYFCQGTQWGWSSGAQHGLPPGTYTLTAASDQAAQFRMQFLLFEYAR